MYLVEFFLSLQPMFPPKPFYCSGHLAAFIFFLTYLDNLTACKNPLVVTNCFTGVARFVHFFATDEICDRVISSSKTAFDGNARTDVP